MKLSRKSFTLIEMLLVLLLIVIAIFPLIIAFSYGIKASIMATYTNIAIELAQQKMEELQIVSYSSLVSTSEPMGTIAGYPNFSREAVVTEPLTNLKQVDVNVYWKVGTNYEQYGLSTYFINY